ncbi:MAG: hypothetical protein ACKVT1_08915 [Dehalococcoidia bacterium]
MALSLADVDELIVLIQQDPVVRDRVRRAILDEDFLALPGIVARIGERIEELAKEIRLFAQETRDRFAELDRKLEAHDGRFDAVDEKLEAHVRRFDAVDRRLDRIDGHIGNLQGDVYETKYVANLASRIGTRFGRVRVVVAAEIPGLSEAFEANRLSQPEWDDVMLLDAAAVAYRRGDAARADVVVVLELSRVVDVDDVRRVNRRADILRRLGMDVEACVDGESILPAARDEAAQLNVEPVVTREWTPEPASSAT